MRLDRAGARTWLLAAVAGWALLAWLLAAAGMGGRLEPLPEDPDLLAPLPPLQPAPPLRLGPAGQYDAIPQRPLFAEDRQPHPFFLEGEGAAAEDDAFDYVLTSVMITPELKLAILQPPEGGRSVRVRLDEAPEPHPAWRLVGLSERSAVFSGPEGQRRLELRVYDGTGGPPPTPVSAGADGSAFDPRAPIAPQLPAPARETPVESEGDSGPARVPRPEPGRDPDAESEMDMPDPSEARPSPPMTEKAQMDAIRQRIQARREQLRRQSTQSPDPNP